MDWIRRNWPDLLIGFALLAVISGIVATLLTGGSFFPLGGNGGQDTPRPTTSQTQGSTSTQNTPLPGTRQPTGNGQQQQAGSAASGIADLPLLSNDPAAGAAVDPLADDGPVDPFADLDDPQDLPVVVAIRPGLDGPPQTAEQAGSAQAPVEQQPAAQTQQQPAAQQPVQDPATPAASQAGSAAAGQQVSSGQAPSSQVPYTVGVGAFRDADNAGRQAAIFRQAGYPVVVASQDDLTVVLLGPYANRTEAERVMGQVTSGGFGVSPIVYTYQGEDGSSQQTATPSTAAPADTPPPAAQNPGGGSGQPVSTPAPAETATAAGRYLQVGAFSSSENATAQADVLQGLGYTVTQQQDGNLIRVLVGPYQAGQLDDARNRLAAQGIDSVPR